MKKVIWKKNVVLLGLVVLLAALPLWLCRDAEFGGADGEAMDAVARLNPAYESWAEPLFSPASGEIESMLFALQAAVGAGVVGFVLGRVTAKGRKDDGD